MVPRICSFLFVAIAIAFPGTAIAQGVSKPITAAVQTAVDRGELLYIYDEAAWHGTDDIRANYPALLAQAGGYVVTGDETDTELVFYDRSKSKAVYRATFSDEQLTKSGPPSADRIPLTALEKRLISAKDSALNAFTAAKVGVCNKGTPNLAALPPAIPTGPVIVYLMTPRIDRNLVPLGGHFSVEIGADGKAGAIRRFMNTCFDMPLGHKPQGGLFVITHLLDPTPTEIHVFSSLTAKAPMVVLTSPDGRMWLIDGNQVQSLPKPKR
jgi:hypothetical protein